MVDNNRYSDIKIQVTQIKESLTNCPGECFASDFLRNYVELFDMYIKLLSKFEKACKKNDIG